MPRLELSKSARCCGVSGWPSQLRVSSRTLSPERVARSAAASRRSVHAMSRPTSRRLMILSSHLSLSFRRSYTATLRPRADVRERPKAPGDRDPEAFGDTARHGAEAAVGTSGLNLTGASLRARSAEDPRASIVVVGRLAATGDRRRDGLRRPSCGVVGEDRTRRRAPPERRRAVVGLGDDLARGHFPEQIQ
jgi:hypothetical protein